ncbi:cytochrome P450 [Favolaschia claudopus]|uniref:Cytochrome P450 n=1 Tax=Favolaschia claudopus TaxID=2862362 RepID=A0AAW0BCC0_9AGAR
MDKRSGSTADRPPMHVADVIAGGLNMAESWRTLRKTAHTILTPQGSMKHLPIQRAEASQLLHDILCRPEAFYTHIRRFANSVILSVLYGKRAPRYETREATAFFEAQHEWELVLEPGATPPIDLIPILKYVPERWAKWKQDCAKTRKMQRKLYFGLLDEAKERLSQGEENGCFMEEILAKEVELGMNREMTGFDSLLVWRTRANLKTDRYLGGILMEGGSDTTSSYLQSLILALVAYPDAQRKA